MFDTGDIVVVRDYEDMKQEYEVRFGDVCCPDGVFFVEQMRHLCGNSYRVMGQGLFPESLSLLTVNGSPSTEHWNITQYMLRSSVAQEEIDSNALHGLLGVNEHASVGEGGPRSHP